MYYSAIYNVIEVVKSGLGFVLLYLAFIVQIVTYTFGGNGNSILILRESRTSLIDIDSMEISSFQEKIQLNFYHHAVRLLTFAIICLASAMISNIWLQEWFLNGFQMKKSKE